MARQRMLHPEFFRHEGLGGLSPLHRIFFAGLWTVADREGRLEDRPKRLGIELLPYDECDENELLNDLQKAGCIVRYEASGRRLVFIFSFLRWQKPHPREAPSNLPAYLNGVEHNPGETQEQPSPEQQQTLALPGNAESFPSESLEKQKTSADAFGTDAAKGRQKSKPGFPEVRAHLEALFGRKQQPGAKRAYYWRGAADAEGCNRLLAACGENVGEACALIDEFAKRSERNKFYAEHFTMAFIGSGEVINALRLPESTVGPSRSPAPRVPTKDEHAAARAKFEQKGGSR